MNPLLFVLSLVSLLLGAFVTLAIAVFGRRFGDRGAPSLIFPLVALFLLSLAEFLRIVLFASPPGILALFSFLEEVSRIVLSFAWVRVCHRHLFLNDFGDFRQALTPILAVLAALSLSLLVALRLAGLDFPPGGIIIDLQVAAFLLYAAISGLVMLFLKPIAMPSTRAILAVAGISVLVYPVVVLADVLGFSQHLGADPGVPYWMQTQPAYYFVICLPLVSFVRRRLIFMGVSGAAIADDSLAKLDLTAREREIMSHLARGQSYKDIAFDLGISLATVKTHVNKAYARLGIQSRSQLQALLAAR
ncbi:MAG: helix-turn-helix transcriptional regulator [Spirochaetota bacterium]